MTKNKIAAWNVIDCCNLKCRFCFGPAIGELIKLSTNQAKQKISQFAKDGYKTLILTGGEPLLRTDIIELIKYAKLKRLKTILHTNGFLVTAKFIEGITNYLDQINLPLDGNNAKSNDAIRTKGHFNKIILLLQQLKNKDIKIIISTVVFQKNIKIIKQIGDLLPRWIYKWRVFQVRGRDANMAIADERFNKLILAGYAFKVQKVRRGDKKFDKSYEFVS